MVSLLTPLNSPFSPSLCNNTLHPSLDCGPQHDVPTLSLLGDEGTIKENGEFLRLEFLFRGRGIGGSVGGYRGSSLSADYAVECFPPLGVGTGHDDRKEIT